MIELEAMLVSQEGLQEPLSIGSSYSIGSSLLDKIFIPHEEVFPGHVSIRYDYRHQGWSLYPIKPTGVLDRIDDDIADYLMGEEKPLRLRDLLLRCEITFDEPEEWLDLPSDSGPGKVGIFARNLHPKDHVEKEWRMRLPKWRNIRRNHGIFTKTFVRRIDQTFEVYPGGESSLQNGDIIILGNIESGYNMMFRENEPPFPTQKLPLSVHWISENIQK